jgi:5-bromo-4-chloroindolyl phosphate hydrolysis protein
MKDFKKQLAYMWKHKEAVIGLIILLALIFSGLILIEIVIDKAL